MLEAARDKGEITYGRIKIRITAQPPLETLKGK
jgi:hypothetical protein